MVPKERATTILVIDASRSMESRDVKPSRLGAAQEAVRRFLDRVPKRMRVGLIVFAGEAQVGAPPTTDRELVRESVDDIGEFSGFGGTAIGDALAAAVQLGRQAVEPSDTSLAADVTPRGPTKGLVSILLLSDGAQTRGELLPLQGAARAKAAGIPVYTVALGTPNGTISGFNGGGGFGFGGPRQVPPDPRTLRAIANATGGQFFAAHSSKSLNAAYDRLGSRLGRAPGKSEITYGLLAAAALLLLAGGLLSARWSPRLP
jgi:Ca-activated chloride channel family protein